METTSTRHRGYTSRDIALVALICSPAWAIWGVYEWIQERNLTNLQCRATHLAYGPTWPCDSVDLGRILILWFIPAAVVFVVALIYRLHHHEQ